MKRILVTILATLYMLSATGATVHLHYCMGRLVSAGLMHKSHDRCDKCGMKKAEQKKGCCKDEHKTFKSADHQLAKVSFHPNFSCTILPVNAISYHQARLRDIRSCKIQYVNAPPSPWRTVPIYIQVCNFRI